MHLHATLTDFRAFHKVVYVALEDTVGRGPCLVMPNGIVVR